MKVQPKDYGHWIKIKWDDVEETEHLVLLGPDPHSMADSEDFLAYDPKAENSEDSVLVEIWEGAILEIGEKAIMVPKDIFAVPAKDKNN